MSKNERRRMKRTAASVAADIRAGRMDVRKLDAWTNRELAELVRKALGRADREPKVDTVRLVGRIVRETEKAVLFAINAAQSRVPLGGEVWLPRSQCTIYERGMGPADVAEITRWIYEEKLKCAQ